MDVKISPEVKQRQEEGWRLTGSSIRNSPRDRNYNSEFPLGMGCMLDGPMNYEGESGVKQDENEKNGPSYSGMRRSRWMRQSGIKCACRISGIKCPWSWR